MNNSEVNSDLIASIYEAGAMPEKWPETLTKVSSSFGASGAIMLCTEKGFDRKTTSKGFENIVEEFALSEWVDNNSRINKLMEYMPHSGFLSDAMLHTKDDLQDLPIYRDFLRPRGLDAAAATVIYGASGDSIILTIEGFDNHSKANESISGLDSLRPHIARSALLSWQVSMQQAQSVVEALEMIGNPAAMLGFRGQIITANTLFEKNLGNSILDFADRMRAVNSQADVYLEKSINDLVERQIGNSIAIPDTKNGISSAMHFVPVAGDARDVFQRSSGLVILAKTQSSILPNANLLEALFDLTSTEARLAQSIGQSKAIADIATEQGVSKETIRWHLKNVMQKTGQNRQVDLANLVKDQSLPIAYKK